MPQSLKQIKNRIRGVASIKKVTYALEMVSMAKLNRANRLLSGFRPYYAGLESFFGHLSVSPEARQERFLSPGEPSGKAVLCVFASDNGLCGTYNLNLFRAADEFLLRQKEGAVVIAVGKKAFNYFRARKREVIQSYLGLNGNYSEEFSRGLNSFLTELFLSGKAREIYFAYNYLQRAALFQPRLEKFLSLEPAPVPEERYILEPPLPQFLGKLLPVYIAARVKLAVLEAFTSEHASRGIAMRMATDNAGELLDDLVVLRNNVRQAEITEDMMEIVSAAESLRE